MNATETELNETQSIFRNSFWLITLPSILLQGIAGIQFLLIRSTILKGSHFNWQFPIFLGVSLMVSLYIGIFRRAVPWAMAIRLFIIFLIGYPLGKHIWLEVTLLLSLLLEAGLYLRLPWNLPVMMGLNGAVILFQKPVSAFYIQSPGPGIQDILFLSVIALMVTLLVFSISLHREGRREDHQIINRLDHAISQLGRANLGFQDLNTSMELETLKKERNRVSREIHDTVGYSLTNIRIMLEAASFMIDSDETKIRELLEKSMNEAGLCLEETRNAMRQLRTKEVRQARGIKSFFQLVSVFGNATGIKVNLEFGNTPDSFGDRVDKAVFRFIQEGLTNSFRHGRATEISIYFWIQNSVLRVSLRDNGTGADSISEGIGLAGMKERLIELNGSISYQNVSDGFEIIIEIPLNREDV